MKYTAYVVPARRQDPIQQIEVDDDTTFSDIIFKGAETGTRFVGMSAMPRAKVQFVYDDMGLYRSDAIHNLNTRMMDLWGTLLGVPSDDITPLVGTFIVMGLNPYTGETQDVPVTVEVWVELQRPQDG